MIRRLTPEDAERVATLRLEALKTAADAFLATYEDAVNDTNFVEKYRGRLATSDEMFTIGYLEEEELVSVATFVRNSATKMRHRGDIYAVYTSSAVRGKGYAQQVMEFLLEEVSGLDGMEQVYLTVVEDNHAAVSLYEKLGFKVYGLDQRAMKADDRYLNEVLMVKEV
ncbi:GNAT family N-acetyltransferase [Mangrovibacillus cuniculi]|uniref:GNAT family N-acetyltransferase n=1 Tax=Mangrovibacillus cuniculi TaxID=2593652 RepID=A0A7S8HEP6_9BACI|nr:GNAT family N-acetyltransferase [Mangrovibacillus cuniculi]QPC45937.1 GNAT family N-acetyltransferase [Mangrovibacillus cuniculi]